MPVVPRSRAFKGQKFISVPSKILKALQGMPFLNNLYITQIGYNPRMILYSVARRRECTDNVFIYCLQGKGWYTFNKQRCQVQAGQFVQIPATKHTLEYGADKEDPGSIYWIQFNGKDMKAFNSSFGITPSDGPRPTLLNEKGIQIWNTMYRTLEMGYSAENLCKTNLNLYGFLASFQTINKIQPSPDIKVIPNLYVGDRP